MAYNTTENLNRRLNMAKAILQKKVAQKQPLMQGDIGVRGQQAGNDVLTKLMTPYLDYWGGGESISDRNAAPMARNRNELLMNLINKRKLASGRGTDIDNVSKRRSDLFNTFRAKKEIGRGLGDVEKNLMFQAGEGAKNRQSSVKQTKARIEFEKEKAKKAAQRAKDQANTEAWIELFSAIPGLGLSFIPGVGPAVGYGAYSGLKSLGRALF
jgi:hypothetical protein